MSTIVGSIECYGGQLNKVRLGDNDWQAINCLLYLPSNYDPSRQYPCLMFAHGNGEAGTDLNKMLDQGLPYVVNEHINNGDIASTDLDKFVIIALQSSWVGGPVFGDELGALAYIRSKISIDPNRIYFTGLSTGGGAACIAIPTRSDIFAAAIAMSSTNTYGDDATKFKDRHIWLMHSVNDTVCEFDYSKNYAERINAIYPENAILTSFMDGHGGWIGHYEPSWKWINPGPGGQDIGSPNGLSIYDWLLQYSLNNVINPVQAPPSPVVVPTPKKTITVVTVEYSDGTKDVISS